MTSKDVLPVANPAYGVYKSMVKVTITCYREMQYNYCGEPERAPHWLKSVMVSYVACTDCENDKIRLTSHSSFVMVSYVACTDYKNDKIRLTSHSSFVMVSYVACTDYENDKIRLTSQFKFCHGLVRRVYGL